MNIKGINNNSNNYNNASKLNFRGVGVASNLVNFWQMIDNGGRGIQFTVEDMCSTNIERTLMGLFNDLKTYNRRKKTYEQLKMQGKLAPGQKPPKLFSVHNFPSTLQEGVREFLTGPIMTFMPAAVLGVCKKTMGKSSNIHLENIINLSELMKSIPEENFANETWKNEFFKLSIQDLIKTTLGDDYNKGDLEPQVLKLKSALEDYYMEFSSNKPDKKTLAKKLGELQSTFSEIVKNNKKEYQHDSFLNAKYTLPHKQIGTAKFKEYAQYICSYAHDISKNSTQNITKEVIDNFRNTLFTKRIGTNIAMFLVTVFAMLKIPKLYTKVSGNINPNGIDVYEQVNQIKATETKNKEVS